MILVPLLDERESSQEASKKASTAQTEVNFRAVL
jgi:hypothetical protein